MVERLLLMFLLVSHMFISGVTLRYLGYRTLPRSPSRIITVENKCDYTVWPGIYNSNSTVTLNTTGFILKKGEARVIDAPSSWEGNFWGRSHCSTNSAGIFSCATGDCGSGKIECAGAPGTPPATLVEFYFSNYHNHNQDNYDVSLVDGYNLPLMVVPESDGSCSSAGCILNLNKTCPLDLKVGREQPVACMSACQAFNKAEYCCDGEYDSQKKCKPTFYSQIFKRECPLAYSYSYDDPTTLFTCSNSLSYVITFCPSTIPNTSRSSVAESPLPAQPKNITIGPPSESPLPARTIFKHSTRAKRKLLWKLKLIVIAGVLATLTIMVIIAVTMVMLSKKKAKKNDWNGKNAEGIVILKRYSYANVKKMTNSFAHVLGKGGFGTVYKGKLPHEGGDVAVKILKETEGSGEEFINEVATLSRTSHVNIVSLLGFCYEGNKRAIIFEFMPNGSLDKYISENMSTKMEWERLYEIALGVSRGLEYLHNRCVSRIVHFDIKPQNILMDKDLCPKISDFGLAKLCKNKDSIMTMLDARGTAGYIAPEVFSKNFGGVSHKSDVYSYGMVILEMIEVRNVKKVKNLRSSNSSTYFPDWIYKDFDRGEKMKIFGDQITEEEEKIAKKMSLVGLWCIQTHPSDRPPMIKVIEMLEGNLDALQVPPKPLWSLPATGAPETVEDSHEISTFSTPSRFERETLYSDSLGF
ncbi:hypothetical protein AALP_AA1G295300 [Arabis alpina]|uniref:Protein kinase domain-containing protein n=1 Tax=Arabis alpina TaxID=50452 RepID=A0A087HRH8_ARAAL|nr:hypothetical protein AALP_AA1G295300 [Arabis alpina]